MTLNPISLRPEVVVVPAAIEEISSLIINGQRYLWIRDDVRAYFARRRK